MERWSQDGDAGAAEGRTRLNVGRVLRYLAGRSAETWAFFACGVLLGAFFG